MRESPRSADPLAGKTIVLGVDRLDRRIHRPSRSPPSSKRGALVDVIMTEAATRFVGPLSFQAITHRPVNTEMFALLAEVEIGHISLGLRADALVVAPATANVLAELALGLADNLLLTTALATRAPMLIAPAMEPLMYSYRRPRLTSPSSASEERSCSSRRRGALPRAASTGAGWSSRRRSLSRSSACSAPRPLRGPPRRGFVGGSSSALARATSQSTRSAISAIAPRARWATRSRRPPETAALTSSLSQVRESLQTPVGVRVVPVEIRARDASRARDSFEGADVLVMAAAVADYRVENRAERKIKREKADEPTLRLVRNPTYSLGCATARSSKSASPPRRTTSWRMREPSSVGRARRC